MFAFFLVQHEDEVKNLMWKNIHLDRREIKFVRGKTDVEIAIHINDRLLSFIKFIMRNRKQISPWVISRWDAKTKRLRPFSSFRSQWNRALKKASFEPGNYKFKEIRHLANTLMKNKGVVADKRRALTGHKSGQANEKYTHPAASDSVEGSEALSCFGPREF
jgi:integrase